MTKGEGFDLNFYDDLNLFCHIYWMLLTIQVGQPLLPQQMKFK